MTNVILIVAFSMILILQPPVITGDVARQLSAQDIADLKSILPSGSEPWLLNGDPGQLPSTQYIEAYLASTVSTPVLRKGPLISVMRRVALNQREATLNGEKMIIPFASSRTDWMIQSSGEYFQVAIEGQSFDQIRGDSDLNRPFRVAGAFADDDLVRLVRLLRSNPNAPSVKGRDGRMIGQNRVQSFPILSINKLADGSVRVMTRRTGSGGQSITLRQEGPKWKVVSVAVWIA